MLNFIKKHGENHSVLNSKYIGILIYFGHQNQKFQFFRGLHSFFLFPHPRLVLSSLLGNSNHTTKKVSRRHLSSRGQIQGRTSLVKSNTFDASGWG